jgi:hypothetical protein
MGSLKLVSTHAVPFWSVGAFWNWEFPEIVESLAVLVKSCTDDSKLFVRAG